MILTHKCRHTILLLERVPKLTKSGAARVLLLAPTEKFGAPEAYASIRQHPSAYVSIRQHTSAYVSIRQHTSAYVSMRQDVLAPIEKFGALGGAAHAPPASVSIRQHTLPYVSIRQHT